MNTPIYDFVRRYQQSGALRLHMPGHKGVPFLGCEPLDITEIAGADALYEAEGIIAQSEANATALFDSGQTLYSTEGSSQCIRAMLHLALLGYGPTDGRRPLILAARNVHKAFLYACALLDLDVAWLMPEASPSSLCACPVTPGQITQALETYRPFALYLTAPDYLGGSPDLPSIAAECRKAGIPLLIDNAHGAYLKFLTPSRHPLDLGAAMCCDSAHKTLPVLTGGAYLHLSHSTARKIGHLAKSSMALFGSTSPSYLILQSLDLCNRYLDDGYPQRLAEFLQPLHAVKTHLSRAGWTLLPSDPLRLVISSSERGYSGTELAQSLRQSGLECEFADRETVVLMLTPENSAHTLAQLEAWADSPLPERSPLQRETLPPLSSPKQKISIRQALLSPCETIPTSQAAGRICAAPTVSCPPAIPIAVSGEEITPELVKRFLTFGHAYIHVVKREVP